LHLRAAATAANGATIATVEFFLDGQLAGRDLTAPYGLSLGGIGPGTRVLTARATDSTGATSTSPFVAVNILSARPEPIWITGNNLIYLGLRHRRLPALVNRIHEVQASTNLLDWPAVTTTPSVQAIGIVEQFETRDEFSTQGQPKRFLRLESRRVNP
jgi:hypothetical protein